jgi:hypothetical protein
MAPAAAGHPVTIDISVCTDHPLARVMTVTVACSGYAATVFPGHLHKSAMMHFSHNGLRATQV